VRGLLALVLSAASVATVAAQPLFSQRGFVEARAVAFPQDAPNDPQNLIGDVLLREDLFARPAPWLQLAAGVELRGNTHDQVDWSWRVDFRDRDLRRPPVSVRRLSATITNGPVTVDVGKQFIRWGKADIVTPTDRFAPRDFLNVVDTEFLAVDGVRTMLQLDANTVDVVWVPFLTPSRTPLLNQRWTAVPPDAVPFAIVDAGGQLPRRSQLGVRWGHTGTGYEYSLSVYDGFNHLPNFEVATGATPRQIQLVRRYPDLRTFGADAAVPTRWFTVKGEAEYFTSPSPATDDYVLWVVQLERQTGEWLMTGGYAGEIVTDRRSQLNFAPDRGLTRSFIARASYTVDANRSVAVETAIRQNVRGVYARVEYSQARGDHWRATAGMAVVGGRADDFLGQYRRNSSGSLALRYSF
jgi:hypothetical protein